jgi:NAD-dependent dihydropyrimidine dehydrogenase PreA subunit
MRKRSMPAPLYPEKCVGCMECVKICPTKTISVTLIQ